MTYIYIYIYIERERDIHTCHIAPKASSSRFRVSSLERSPSDYYVILQPFGINKSDSVLVF